MKREKNPRSSGEKPFQIPFSQDHGLILLKVHVILSCDARCYESNCGHCVPLTCMYGSRGCQRSGFVSNILSILQFLRGSPVLWRKPIGSWSLDSIHIMKDYWGFNVATIALTGKARVGDRGSKQATDKTLLQQKRLFSQRTHGAPKRNK